MKLTGLFSQGACPHLGLASRAHDLDLKDMAMMSRIFFLPNLDLLMSIITQLWCWQTNWETRLYAIPLAMHWWLLQFALKGCLAYCIFFHLTPLTILTTTEGTHWYFSYMAAVYRLDIVTYTICTLWALTYIFFVWENIVLFI